MVPGSGSNSKSAGDTGGVDALAVAAGDRLTVERHQRTLDHFLRTGRDEAGVDELDAVDLAGSRTCSMTRWPICLGVGVRRVVAEAAEGGADLVATEAEVALGLAADGDDRVVGARRAHRP